MDKVNNSYVSLVVALKQTWCFVFMPFKAQRIIRKAVRADLEEDQEEDPDKQHKEEAEAVAEDSKGRKGRGRGRGKGRGRGRGRKQTTPEISEETKKPEEIKKTKGNKTKQETKATKESKKDKVEVKTNKVEVKTDKVEVKTEAVEVSDDDEIPATQPAPVTPEKKRRKKGTPKKRAIKVRMTPTPKKKVTPKKKCTPKQKAKAKAMPANTSQDGPWVFSWVWWVWLCGLS